VDDPRDRFDAGDACGDEDRTDDEQACDPLGAFGPDQERDTERNRRERVAGVVDQVGEQGDAACQQEDHGLHSRAETKYPKRPKDGVDSCAGTLDRVVDQSV
jgi:hypothetical protein